VCSLLVAVILGSPRLGGSEHLWMNSLYEGLCIVVLFPLIVSLGAGSSLSGKYTPQICRWLGQISYPLYITHYVFVYVYIGWVTDHQFSLAQVYPYTLLVFFGSIAVAYAGLKLFDEPVRRWLQKRWLAK
jgi:peptidoglycan/LPS O-acetylase OafA/YrhL